MYIYIFKSHHRPGEMFLTGAFVVIASTIAHAQQLVDNHPTGCDWRPILFWRGTDIPWEVVIARDKVAFILVKRLTVKSVEGKVILHEGGIFEFDGDYLHA